MDADKRTHSGPVVDLWARCQVGRRQRVLMKHERISEDDSIDSERTWSCQMIPELRLDR
jgi:hypothetical protein